MASSITRLTALDHERLQRLLRRALADGPSQLRWRDEVVQLARAHRRAESDALTPEALAPAGPEAAAAVDRVVRPDGDDEVEAAAAELCAAAVPSPELRSAGRRFRTATEAHAKLLDAALRQLEAAVPRREMRRLGGEYERRRDDTLRAMGEDQPPPRRLDLPRAELYELARKAGISGRSAMSRRDLIAELQRRDAGS
jgi:hypothetical protein